MAVRRASLAIALTAGLALAGLAAEASAVPAKAKTMSSSTTTTTMKKAPTTTTTTHR